MNHQEEILRNWMQQYGRGVWDFIYSMTRSQHTADDLTQDVFVSAFTHLDQFRHGASPKTWLFSIAKNKCTDYFRSAFFRRITSFDRIDSPGFRTTEDEVLSSMAVDEIWKAIFSLKKGYREVVLLHIKEDMPFEDVGTALDISANTARVRYHRALRQLRTILGEEMVNHELRG